MKLTCGKLLQQQDWSDWQDLEYLQLNQYKDQGKFGKPVAVTKDDAIFHLVWTYSIIAVDGRKKAHCICDGSTWSGQVRILGGHMQTASTRLVLECSMLLLPPKIS
jgi:hypothetical protein